MEERAKVYQQLKYNNSRKGFTLVELIVVLVVVAIISAVVVPALLGYTDEAKEKKYITEAKAAMSSSQTVLTDAYTDGLTFLPKRLRDEALSTSGLDSNTEFIVWTAKSFELADGTFKTTSSYTINSVLYTTKDKNHYVYYNGTTDEWTVYSTSDTADVAAVNTIKNGNSDTIIFMWPYTVGDAKYAGDTAHREDIAYTAENTEQDENWQPITEDDDWVDNGEEVGKEPSEDNFMVDLILEKESSQTSVMEFKLNNVIKDSIHLVYSSRNGWQESGSNKWDVTANVICDVKDARYKTPSWSNNAGLSYADITDVFNYVTSNAASLDGGTETFYASCSHGTIQIPATFSAAANSADLDVKVAGTTDNKVTFLYDKVDGTLSVSGGTAFSVTCGPKASIESANPGAVVFSDVWVTNNIVVYNNETHIPSYASKETSTSGIEALIKQYAEDCISKSGESIESASQVSFEGYEDIYKTVYLRGKLDETTGEPKKDANDNYLVTFGDSPTWNVTFVKCMRDEKIYEVASDGSKTQNEVVTSGSGAYSFFTAYNKSALTNVVALNIREHLILKYWNCFSCKKDGSNVAASAISGLDKIHEKDITASVLGNLYNISEYGILAEVDVSNCAAKYKSLAIGILNIAANDTIDPMYNSPLKQLFLTLAGNDKNKIKNIRYISESALQSNRYDSRVKEICLSETQIQSGANNRLARKAPVGDETYGEFEISDIPDPEYPGYIVGYSVTNGNGYDIYVFSEEDTMGKVTGSAIRMFDDFPNMVENNLVSSNMDTSEVTNMYSMFGGDTNLRTNISVDVSGAHGIARMFKGCKNIQSISLTGTPSQAFIATGLVETFCDCNSLTSLSMPTLNTTNVTSMKGLYQRCKLLTTINVKVFSSTSSVTDMSYMFDNCNSLSSIDLTSFDTSNVITMRCMFANSLINNQKQYNRSLRVLDLSSFSTENLTDIGDMFTRCETLTTIYVAEDQWYGLKNSSQNTLNGAQTFKGCKALVGGNGTETNDTKINDNTTEASGVYAYADEAGVDYNNNGTTNDKGYFTIKITTNEP